MSLSPHVAWLLDATPAEFYQWHKWREKGEVTQSLVAVLEEWRSERAGLIEAARQARDATTGPEGRDVPR